MSALELQVATAALRKLGAHGLVELEYMTAEFEPFSSAQRPDLVFWPSSGPNQGRAFVVELRMPKSTHRMLPTPEIVREHRDFVEDSTDCVYFALATNGKVDDISRSAFSAEGIEVFERVESGEDLANRILKWTGTPQFLSQI